MENSTTFAPPLSGVVLSHLIKAFDLCRFDKAPMQGDETPVLSGRTASRFFAGGRISPDAENEIWQATATALVAADLLPPRFSIASVFAVVDPVRKELAAIPPEVVLAQALASLGNHWDETAGAVRRLTAPVGFPRHAAGACLRLVVIDLCVRLTGLLWLTRSPGEQQLPRTWADAKGVSTWLRQLLGHCSPSLTRDQFAQEVGGKGVHEHTVDGWLDDDVRPSDENLQDIAQALSEHGVGDLRDVLRQLRLTYSLRALFEVIQGAIGEEQAEGLASRIIAIPVFMLNIPRNSQKPAENDLKMRLAMIFGTLGRGELSLPQIEAMLNAVWRVEPSPVWRTSIKAATRSWFEHLQYITAKLGPTTDAEWRAAGIPIPSEEELEQLAYHAQASKEELVAQDPMFARAFASEVLEGGRFGALELKMQSMDRVAAHDFAGAVRLLRRAAEQDPSNAEIHFRLGCCLWQDGDIAGGLAELEIAVQLRPGWDRPPVEIAIVLLNLGRDDEALRKLEAAGQLLQEPSAWHLLHLAFAHERLGEVGRAAEVYEELLRLDGDHGEALDRLAHLRFLQRDKVCGNDLAKRAAHLGFTDVFDAVNDGYYKGKLPNERPLVTTPEHLRHLRPNDAKRMSGSDGAKVGRGDPCPCGSGKKFKKCHGNN